MMKQIILFALLGLWCCTPEKKQSPVQEVSPEFTRYLDLLPIVNLPFETNCGQCCNHPEIDKDSELINKFTPAGASIVGIVSRTEERVIILLTYSFDMIVPSLKVYDLNGNLKGEMNFMTDYCGGEPAFYNRQFFKIDKNLSLSQIDSLYYMTYDSITYHTIDTTNIRVTRADFKVSEKGEIVESGARQEHYLF